MDWIDRNMCKIVIGFMIVMIMEVGIGAWKMPKEVRTKVIPILQEHIMMYDSLEGAVEGLVNERQDIRREINMLLDQERLRSLSGFFTPTSPAEHTNCSMNYLPPPPRNPQNFHTL